MRVDRAALMVVGALAIVVACAAGSSAVPAPGTRPPGRPTSSKAWRERIVRVALATAVPTADVSADGDWRLFGDGGRTTLARARAGATWTIERQGRRLRAVRDDGTATAWAGGPLVVSAVDEQAPVRYAGRAYRGELWIAAVDTAIRVINRVFVEDYVRSVVPAEIGGGRSMAEHAAVEAQAVAARSYVYTRLGSLDNMTGYDVVASTTDQVYHGVSAERPFTNIAVDATDGLVLYYRGRPVSAPYHSTCGGMTAAAGELFRSLEEPHLQRVSDRIPGTDRYYCQDAPRFRWSRTLDGPTLDRAMATYLRRYARAGTGPVGSVRDVRVDGVTESGRAAAIVVETDAGTFRVRGNDARFVLRAPNGEMLNSTYFSLTTRSDGQHLRSLTITGSGYGHGVGMCQFGALGRARAGQDFRAILSAYYPGTTIAQAR